LFSCHYQSISHVNLVKAYRNCSQQHTIQPGISLNTLLFPFTFFHRFKLRMTENSTTVFTTISDTVDNDTEFDEYAGIFDPVYHIPPLICAVIIIGLNAWAISLVKTFSNLQTNMNLLLSSLAFSDLLTGLLSIPSQVACDIIRETPVCVASQLMMRFTSVSTISHLLAITIDRHIGVKHSLRYNVVVTKRRVFITSAFIWCSSIFTSLIQLAWINYKREDVDEEDDDIIKHEIRYDVTWLILYFLLPFVIMTVVYADIFMAILRQYRHIKRYNNPGWLETKRRTHGEWRAVIIFSIMLLVFVICWLPFFALRLHYNLGYHIFEISPILVYLFIYLRFFTSIFNPCAFILAKRDFRQAISASRRILFTRLRSNSLHSSVKTTTV